MSRFLQTAVIVAVLVATLISLVYLVRVGVTA